MHTAPRIALIGVFVNAALAVGKTVAGYYGNSQALLADGIESGTDVLSSTLVFLALRYASKPADKNHPYGHGRAERPARWHGRSRGPAVPGDKSRPRPPPPPFKQR